MLQTISHEHINEQIYKLLLSKIVSQEFAPGQRLRVDEVAARLGVSRTPVKDAVNRLAADGLVVVMPRKGTFVADITPEGIHELFDVRLMMELHAAESAIPRATGEDIAELERLFSSMDRFRNDDGYTDYESFLELDTLFHMKLFELAGNAMLTRLYRGINLHVQVVRAYQKAPGAAGEATQTQDEHRAIVAAFKNKNSGALQHALTEHIQKREQQFIRALQAKRNTA